VNLMRLEAIAFWWPKRPGGILDSWNDHEFSLASKHDLWLAQHRVRLPQ
jgi:hypothetical protein